MGAWAWGLLGEAQWGQCTAPNTGWAHVCLGMAAWVHGHIKLRLCLLLSLAAGNFVRGGLQGHWATEGYL